MILDRQAENAIRELQQDGFNMKKLSIVGKDYHTEEHVVGYYTAGNRLLYWGKIGALWGGFWDCYSAPGSFGCRALVNCWRRGRSSLGSSARARRGRRRGWS